MLWLKAAGKVIGRGLLELLFGVLITVGAVLACGVIALLFGLVFQVLFFLFGDGWFIAIGNWLNNGGINTILWVLLGGAVLCLLAVLGLEIRDTKIKMEEEMEEDEELAEGD